ncbi:MAG: NYN domain-containing protein [Clostridia bacterium]|nr:NYN domain-containing protein [Clostridia bacterium]
MKRIVCGILAHVDSGKTTLSEGILYSSGQIRHLGRVDHRDSYLDTDTIEKERGITIFSHQAAVNLDDLQLTLLDTPGHVDFSAEMERTLNVLDYAILVISGVDMVQSHTHTLWELLKKYRVPTFIFVNKMDMPLCDKNTVMADLIKNLDQRCVDFSDTQNLYDNLAMCYEDLMDEFLEKEEISVDAIAHAIKIRRVFPCFFGSALKLTGVSEFLEAISRYILIPPKRKDFGAKVFKITKDDKNVRLTHMKITGGTLRVRDIIEKYGEKINEIRIYSGKKYLAVSQAYQGDVVAVSGLSKTYSNEALGNEIEGYELSQEPVFSYKVNVLSNINIEQALIYLQELEEEEPGLHIEWNEHFGEIRLQLMGEVQLEVIKRIIKDRFDMDVEFMQGSIIYRETIEDKVEGVGHYEPLRHYAEVHLMLEPLPRGAGLVFRTDCSEDILDKNWQRLVLTHLEEKTHLGVLTGSPITDMKITLVSGRAHLKHTEGGDFRQATYRAVRQGLMCAKSVLLEPWYKFTLELPVENVGRAMTDIEKMGGRVNPPEMLSTETAVLEGSAPISKMHDYTMEINAYTHGLGRLSCSFLGYDKCAEQEAVVKSINYDPEADLYNSPDSVFCSHGAGFSVKWNEVKNYMHIEAQKEKPVSYSRGISRSADYVADDDELLKIFEATYGKIVRKSIKPLQKVQDVIKHKKAKAKTDGPEYLLIDGYNIIFAWDSLKELAKTSLEAAREALINRVLTYRAMKQIEVIIVFDAYRVKGNRGEVEKVNDITVVYTKEAETADSYIERATHELSKNHKVRVATSDNLEQLIILGNGALRVSAMEFLEEINRVDDEVMAFLDENNRGNEREFKDATRPEIK